MKFNGYFTRAALTFAILILLLTGLALFTGCETANDGNMNMADHSSGSCH